MDWFKHDINAHEDIKIRKLKRMHGMAAYGVYWELVELMYSKGGSLQESSILDEIMLMGIEEDDARDMVDSFLDLGLFTTDGESWFSDRVTEEFTAANSRRENMRALSNKRWGMRSASDTHATRMRHASDTHARRNPRGEENKDNTVSSPLQEEYLLFTEKSETGKTHSIITSEPSKTKLEGSEVSKDPVVLFLPTNKGEEYPITESKVKLWEEAYPAVDVRSQLREMRAWCMSNPKNRKTSAGMDRFCNSWLSRQQDRSRRIPQHNTEVIRGTNIGMTLVADGTRPDQEYKEVHFE